MAQFAISTLSLTSTSVTITWTSQLVPNYTVSLRRVTGDDQILCRGSNITDNTDSRTPVTVKASNTFTNLQEYSKYNVTVTALGITNRAHSMNFEFITPGAGMQKPCIIVFMLLLMMLYVHITIMTVFIAPTGVPRNTNYSVASRNASFSWNSILCIDRNGEIIHYEVVFQKQDGAMILDEVSVMNRTFNTDGLTPHTNYTFRVAGVNINGTGPFSNSSILTHEDGIIILSLAGQT